MAHELVVSALGNRIYLVNEKHLKKREGGREVTGKKEDVTDKAVMAVFQWFVTNMEYDESNAEYRIDVPNSKYRLKMVKLENESEDDDE